MNPDVVPSPDLLPLVTYFAAVVAVVAVMMGLSHVLGERGKNPAKATLEPFESGIVATGTPLIRFSVRFYLIAIFFVIFDIEAVFIFAWAIGFRESGWAGYIEILIFIAVLIAALAYLWLIGALDWRTERQKAVDGKTAP
ncbi:MAG TPA: NADH-quinone oxidoreductase subunit A [Methylococcaceae bacterium]|nr:NADH-quinone oxidoreductase subunit A [Methylococcaceae bacterium]